MVSDLIGDVADEAGGFVDDAVGEDLAKADKILSGADRAPIDIEKVEAEFIRGIDLSTPDGEVPSTAAAPNDSKASGKTKTSTLSTAKRIELIHFGYVHRDVARSFDHGALVDDMETVDLSKVVGSRAIAFRAALEREAVLLAGFARATSAALAEKDQKEGASGDLLTAAADLLGGSGGTAQAAAAADLSPFIDKIDQQAWTPMNKSEIKYTDLHDAGIKLHEVRANLRRYIREQLDAQKNAPPVAKGLLSDLPLVGEIPIPGVLGEIIGFMQKVTGKLHDVQTALIFDLLLVMQKPIEKACMTVSLDAIKKRTSPIYPAWFLPPPPAEQPDAPFADYQQDDVIGGDLKKIDELDAINKGIQDGVGSANDALNKAAEKPLELIDFLSKETELAPGSPYLAEIFRAEVEPGGPWLGSAFLAKKAVGAFGRAMGSGEIPGFMTGFVSTLLENVFAICAEFLRAVYDKLCCLTPTETISSQELVVAGRNNLVFQIVELVLEKTGLDEILKDIKFDIPQPPVIPPGINWPDATLTTDPIIAELELMLADKLGPYIDPVVEYMMSGLAQRLNAQRMWAGPQAMTMEVHLAQLPGEIALMFRNLFGPLWEFLTDTLMGIINDAVAKVLGPIGNAVGVAKGGLDQVTGAIADAKRKAAQAQAYAKNVEDKAKDLMNKASDIKASLSDQSDLYDIKDAAEALGDAVGDNPFTDDPAATAAQAGASGFPGNRKSAGTGAKIDKAVLDGVETKWEDAKPEGTAMSENDGQEEARA